VIVHCDMKPQNILIVEGNRGGLVAKIADFGSSMIGQEEEDMYSLPHSGIWSAPEYHHRKISIAAAKKMDAYSFSLICLWLLLDEPHGAIDGDSSTTVLRQSCDFIARAHDLVTSLDLENEASQRLGCLFETTLADDPLKRIIDVQAMPKLLDPNR
jgi:serine/threonine protein kinase